MLSALREEGIQRFRAVAAVLPAFRLKDFLSPPRERVGVRGTGRTSAAMLLLLLLVLLVLVCAEGFGRNAVAMARSNLHERHFKRRQRLLPGE